MYRRFNAHKIRVMIVDDHPMLRMGIRALIDTQPDMTVCGESGNASDALEKIIELRPDLATVDLKLGTESGFELIRQMLFLGCTSKILVLSMYEDSCYVERAAAAGAHGYVKKRMAAETLLPTIRILAAQDLQALTPANYAIASV